MYNSNTMKVVGGILGIAISLLFFTIALSGIDAVLNNAYLADYTALETIVKITPKNLWVGNKHASGLTQYIALKGSRGGKKSRSLMA